MEELTNFGELTHAIVKLHLEKGDLNGALKVARELERRTLNREEWGQACRKIPPTEIMVNLKTSGQKSQTEFIKWLKGGIDAITLISACESFGQKVDLIALANIMDHHIEQGESDSEEQLCAGAKYVKMNFPGLHNNWALNAKEIALARGKINAALIAADLSGVSLSEAEIISLIISYTQTLTEAIQKDKKEVIDKLEESKNIMLLLEMVPDDKKIIYEKIRSLIFD